jgi:hypothetical protein
MKKINGSIASGELMPLQEIAKECYLDEKILESVAGKLDQPVKSMRFFFATMENYIIELQKRVEMLNECYTAVQQAQIAKNTIKATPEISDPPIVW